MIIIYNKTVVGSYIIYVRATKTTSQMVFHPEISQDSAFPMDHPIIHHHSHNLVSKFLLLICLISTLVAYLYALFNTCYVT